jgi:siroheme synthase
MTIYLEHGKDPTTPAAAIAPGTQPGERTVAAALAELPDAARDLERPALIVIGGVVDLRDSLVVHQLETEV